MSDDNNNAMDNTITWKELEDSIKNCLPYEGSFTYIVTSEGKRTSQGNSSGYNKYTLKTDDTLTIASGNKVSLNLASGIQFTGGRVQRKPQPTQCELCIIFGESNFSITLYLNSPTFENNELVGVKDVSVTYSAAGGDSVLQEGITISM